MPRPSAQGGEPLPEDLSRARDSLSPGLPDYLFRAGMTSWVYLFGVVSFELFGQFNNVVEARADYFSQQMELMGLYSETVGKTDAIRPVPTRR